MESIHKPMVMWYTKHKQYCILHNCLAISGDMRLDWFLLSQTKRYQSSSWVKQCMFNTSSIVKDFDMLLYRIVYTLFWFFSPKSYVPPLNLFVLFRIRHWYYGTYRYIDVLLNSQSHFTCVLYQTTSRNRTYGK